MRFAQLGENDPLHWRHLAALPPPANSDSKLARSKPMVLSLKVDENRSA